MIVHGGLEKAASTFLQKVVFPRINGHRYDAETSRLLKALGYGDLGQVEPAITERLGSLRGAPRLLSSEQFWCRYHHYLGGPTYSPELALTNLVRLAGPDVRLLMVLRRRDDAIDSMIRYKRRFLSNPDMLIADYPVRANVFGVYRIASQYGRLLRTYDYYPALVLAANILGRENVEILLYEDLAEEPERFFQRLSAVFGEDLHALADLSGRRVNAVSPKYDRLVDGYVPMGHVTRKLNNLTGHRLEKLLPRRDTALTDRRRREILGIFRDNNARLAELFDVDLARYGYC